MDKQNQLEKSIIEPLYKLAMKAEGLYWKNLSYSSADKIANSERLHKIEISLWLFYNKFVKNFSHEVIEYIKYPKRRKHNDTPK